ncbi:hypothetical protein KRE40_11195 [Elizabethkingia meningoseptica]|uniref:hypothetical protein n=2 Tax=Elizabethkingia meningoseptica TaxID=238 RepID=UPI000998F9ED|nr:hypothetical protein [Elizabethkingia meningoseptica]MDE5439231.1 hypothetical protein [Elizabethkingia meningoseptica]MDE5509210.1 hypothetical protein [Elizabethkingia meningoseptica]MDE5516641.1 hypothetical protein [Elizabethkingia meningoseptica]MDE5527572.1 hypothetical protein [Elizabethkingia meningoseptica]MDE5534766.1 hypothetical protein [Elizabethkingia meningoseptica]
MTHIKNAYYYFFYKMYKLINYTSEISGGAFLTDFKASLAMIALEIWFGASLFNYYAILIDESFSVKKEHFIVLGILIILLNYSTFDHNSVWKDYIKKFDQLPEKVNKRGGVFFYIIIISIIGNFILSLYLLNEIREN